MKQVLSSKVSKIRRSDQTPIRSDLLHALIDHAEHGITIAEREGDDTILLYVNQAFEKMTGYSVDECLYKDCRFLQGDDGINNDHDQIAKERIQKAIEDEKEVRVLLRNYMKDGTLFWNDLSITPYFDAIDGIMYYIGIQKDITSFIALQNELASTKAKLNEK